MDTIWNLADFERTIMDYEFTRRAVHGLQDVVYSADFEDMDADMIFLYLLREMNLVSFKDYLKRFLYERMNTDTPFSKVPEETYQKLIVDAFRRNGAPHAFGPTSKKLAASVKGWLRQDGVKRETVFLLGFGLKMSPEEVSEFLTKVLREDDFDMQNPAEVIYRHCYSHGLPYIEAQKLLQEYEQLEGCAGVGIDADKTVKQVEYEKKAYDAFREALEAVQEIVAQIYNEDNAETGNKRVWTGADVSPADVERVLCSGIPVTGNGNLAKASASLLGRHFHQRRMSRQRIESILKKQTRVERFDLITLTFFLHAVRETELEPEIRCAHFLDTVNEILAQCRMMAIYPVNPYESFILMCLLSEDPLSNYAEIWERSYQSETIFAIDKAIFSPGFGQKKQ